jgi:hypothetical protein
MEMPNEERPVRLILIGLTFLFPSLAFADCNHPGIPWRFGATFTSTWVTTGGSICKSRNKHVEHIASITMVTKASHGIAGPAELFAVAYKPDAGFRGSDFFEYAVTSNANYRKGPGLVAYVKVNVISR